MKPSDRMEVAGRIICLVLEYASPDDTSAALLRWAYEELGKAKAQLLEKAPANKAGEDKPAVSQTDGGAGLPGQARKRGRSRKSPPSGGEEELPARLLAIREKYKDGVPGEAVVGAACRMEEAINSYLRG